MKKFVYAIMHAIEVVNVSLDQRRQKRFARIIAKDQPNCGQGLTGHLYCLGSRRERISTITCYSGYRILGRWLNTQRTILVKAKPESEVAPFNKRIETLEMQLQSSCQNQDSGRFTVSF